MRLTGDGEAFRGTDAHAEILRGAECGGRYVLLENRAWDTANVGGKRLVVPDSVKQDLAWVVVAIGPKALDVCAIDVGVGDRVVFQGGTKLVIGKRLFAIIDAASLMLKLDREHAGKFFDAEGAVLTTISGEMQ
jgi:co-chaperonin GroES (HSP10)